MTDHPYPTERTWTDCEAELERLRESLKKEQGRFDARLSIKEAEIDRLRVDKDHWKFCFDSCAKDRANLIDEVHELRKVLQQIRQTIKGVQENG